MTDLRKLLEDARSALYALGEKHYDKIAERIDAALAEPVEPVAWQMPDGDLIANDSADTVGMWRIGGKPLYAAPADQWRRVEDGLPDEWASVVISDATKTDQSVGYYGKGIWTVKHGYFKPAYWFYLPALPESDK